MLTRGAHRSRAPVPLDVPVCQGTCPPLLLQRPLCQAALRPDVVRAGRRRRTNEQRHHGVRFTDADPRFGPLGALFPCTGKKIGSRCRASWRRSRRTIRSSGPRHHSNTPTSPRCSTPSKHHALLPFPLLPHSAFRSTTVHLSRKMTSSNPCGSRPAPPPPRSRARGNTYLDVFFFTSRAC